MHDPSTSFAGYGPDLCIAAALQHIGIILQHPWQHPWGLNDSSMSRLGRLLGQSHPIVYYTNTYPPASPAGTGTSDRVCADCTVCGVDTSYMAEPCTRLIDAVCAPRTVCMKGKEYVSAPGSPTEDTTCSTYVVAVDKHLLYLQSVALSCLSLGPAAMCRSRPVYDTPRDAHLQPCRHWCMERTLMARVRLRALTNIPTDMHYICVHACNSQLRLPHPHPTGPPRPLAGVLPVARGSMCSEGVLLRMTPSAAHAQSARRESAYTISPSFSAATSHHSRRASPHYRRMMYRDVGASHTQAYGCMHRTLTGL